MAEEARAPSVRPPARLNAGDLVASLSALLLLVFMFAFAWYGVDGVPGRSSQAGIATAEDAWSGLPVLRWLMLATILVVFGSVALHARSSSRPQIARARLAVLLLGSLTAALVAYRVLLSLPSPDWVVDQKLGAYLGVLSAAGIALGAYEAVREQRARLIAQFGRSRPGRRLARSRPAQ